MQAERLAVKRKSVVERALGHEQVDVVDAGNHCLVSSRLFISTLFYYISFNQQHSG
jgi:hypothetical protein